RTRCSSAARGAPAGHRLTTPVRRSRRACARGPHARALMLSLVLSRRDAYRRVRYHPLYPLSEEKAVRSLRIDIVTQKTRKKWKLLREKKGRLSRRRRR